MATYREKTKTIINIQSITMLTFIGFCLTYYSGLTQLSKYFIIAIITTAFIRLSYQIWKYYVTIPLGKHIRPINRQEYREP